MSQPLSRGLWLRLFLPFAGGYFLSYLFRTVNAVIGPLLAGQLALGDNALGLLTSTYFLAFGLAQLPLGVLLDRFGPRRVEASLLVIAGLGAAVFAQADNLGGLALGRGLIGLGVSACLMASFKTFALWFPVDRQASLTGWVMAAGGLGALAASKPLELVLSFTGWRPVMLALALITVLVAGSIAWLVPEKAGASKQDGLRDLLAGLHSVFSSGHFWRYAPMGFWMTGGFMAVQGIWASRWMMVQEALSAAEIALRLTWISGAMLAGFLFMGFFATRLIHRGVNMTRLYFAAMALASLCLMVITALPGHFGFLLWPLLAACFSLSNISYSLVAHAFPAALSGRATTAYNLLVFAGAFILQWGIGSLIDGLQALGWATGAAYRGTFLLLILGQSLALAWFMLPSLKQRGRSAVT